MLSQQSFRIAKHAEVLAAVYLSRRSDLTVIPVSRYDRDAGYDILVQLDNDEIGLNVSFAIEAKGMSGEHSKPHNTFPVRYSTSQIKARSLPVCVFLFNVDSEQGYYRWLFEPVVDEIGRSSLQLDHQIERALLESALRDEPRRHGWVDKYKNRHWRDEGGVRVRSEFANLDEEALQTIISQVEHWYRSKLDGNARPGEVERM